MGYINININYNESALCEEISFTEPGKQEYIVGDIIDFQCPVFCGKRLRDREMIIYSVNYTEDDDSGFTTTVSGFSVEYAYTRKAPASDVSYFTMTPDDYSNYLKRNPKSDSVVKIMYGDDYGSSGWTMHSIILSLCGQMGLNVQNTLSDYFISDFTVSLGSTYFEAIVGLVSVFKPIIVVSGGILFILERSSVGIMAGGAVPLVNVTHNIASSGVISNSMDKEYVPVPGCIKVEGQEGEYIASKDISGINSTPVKDSITTRETIKNDDGTTANYNNSLEFYKDPYNNQWASIKRVEECTILPEHWGYFLSKTKNTVEMEYDPITINFKYSNPVLVKETKICEAWVGSYHSGSLEVYNKIETSYTYDIEDWSLKLQLATKQELFIFDPDDSTYIKYDPRDYDPEEDGTTLLLVQTEQRSTIYTYLTSEAYSVDTQISSQVYNEDEEEWQTVYTFEHDLVLAGGQQHTGGTSGVSSLRTLQVYHGNCPVTPIFFSYDEPGEVFSVSTPSWGSIVACYNALKAMLEYEFQKGTVRTLAINWYWNVKKDKWQKVIFDPIPFMQVSNLSDFMEEGIKGNYYITGYNISLDPNSGYTVNLDLEARRA